MISSAMLAAEDPLNSNSDRNKVRRSQRPLSDYTTAFDLIDNKKTIRI